MLLLLVLCLVCPVLSFCPNGTFDTSTYGNCAQLRQTENDYGYYEAEIGCQDLGGHLVSVRNAFHNSLLVSLLRQVGLDKVYIGADNHKGTWNWIDGTNMNYSNLILGEHGSVGYPTPWSKCATLNGNDGKWYAVDCSQKLPYLCGVPQQNYVCPQNWTMFNGNCYWFANLVPSSVFWQAAEDLCVKNNAHLVSIHSAEENRFLVDQMTQLGETWIGLKWDSGYSWSDGTPVDVNNATAHAAQPSFYSMYPPGYSPPSRAGWWQDNQKGTALYSFICKGSPTLKNTIPETSEFF